MVIASDHTDLERRPKHKVIFKYTIYLLIWNLQPSIPGLVTDIQVNVYIGNMFIRLHEHQQETKVPF